MHEFSLLSVNFLCNFFCDSLCLNPILMSVFVVSFDSDAKRNFFATHFTKTSVMIGLVRFDKGLDGVDDRNLHNPKERFFSVFSCPRALFGRSRHVQRMN